MAESAGRQVEVERALHRCSVETISAADRFIRQRQPEDAMLVVHGVLARGKSEEHSKAMAALGGGARLIEDLGYESLELMEAIMTLEVVFRFELDAMALREVRTLADLERFVRAALQKQGE